MYKKKNKQAWFIQILLKVKATSKITAKLAAKWEFTLEELKNWTSTDYSVYTGTAGIGLLFLRKAPDEPQNLRVNLYTL